MLRSLASLCYRRRWLVLAFWAAALVGIQAAAGAAGDSFSQEFKLDGAESYEAFQLIDERFPERSGAEGEVVFLAEDGIDDPTATAAMEELFASVEALDGVESVISPYDAEGAAQVAPPSAGEYAGRIGFATVQFSGSWGDLSQSTLDEIESLASGVDVEGLQVELGGDVFAEQAPPGTSELIGLVAAVLILLVAFGSVVAMGLPIGTALFGLAVGFGAVGLISHVVSVPEFSTQLAAMIGIGVGIDYALFIVTRYRQGLTNGLEPHDSVVAAVDTAGRAVIFAGITVVISLAGMLLIGIEFVGGLGVAAASVVLVTMLISVTLLPALLGFAGRNIDKLSLPGASKRAEGGRHGYWYRWSRTLQAHPWPAALGGLAVLLLLAVPVLSMQFGFTDAGNRSESDTTRRAYDLKAQAFGEGSSAPLVLVATVPEGGSVADLLPVAEAVMADDGVAFVLPPQPNPDGDLALIPAIPSTSGQDPATIETIERLRDEVLPAATADTDAVVLVGGTTALFEDMSVKLQQRLPVFIGVVLGLSFLLLLVVFRSVLVPVKAVIMNLLSIGAAYGLIVAIFQWGWFGDLVGIGRPGPIESFLPMMMFAILFGLSMDYEVFLLSRIKEEYDRTGDNGLAVADGLSATARVITAAALIMVTVFGSFVFSDERVVKMFGIGLAAAIFIDATVVRMVLVPATMELMGRANWWFPRWLSWLPVVHVEGSAEDIEATSVHEPPFGVQPDEPEVGDGPGGDPVLVGERGADG